MISYFVEFALIHLFLFAVYLIFLRQETQLPLIRNYLLASIVLALVIPFLHIPANTAITQVDITGSVTTFLLPEIMISASGVTEGTVISQNQVFVMILIAGSVVAFLRVIISLSKILRLFIKSTVVYLNNTKVRHIEGLKSSFTFFNLIFIDKDYYDKSSEIINHEEAHARYWHSVDLLVLNLLTIPFWWLPSIWLCISEMRKIHEYQADAFAMARSSSEHYLHALVDSTLKYHGMTLSNSFNDTPINKRLSFMKKLKKNMSPIKITSLVIVLALTVLTFACEENLDSQLPALTEMDLSEEYPDLVQQKLVELQSDNPDAEFVVIQVPEGDELPEISMKALKFLELVNIEEQNVTIMIVQKGGMLPTIEEKKESQDKEEIFTVVEEPPTFPGGIQDAFFNYVSENIKYPEEARTRGVTGKVFVQFIVGKDGEVRDVIAVRGIGAGCDEEAVRVIKNSPNWMPGKQRGAPVSVRMILPIYFNQ